MMTTTHTAGKDNQFDHGKDFKKATPVHCPSNAAPGGAQLAREWFDAQALPGLPLHLELMLLGN